MELFVLVLALVGVARVARTRGASPWLYGIVAIVGFFVVGALVAAALASLGYVSSTGGLTLWATLATSVAQWSWIGLVLLYVRFGIGRTVEGPTGAWSCPNCHSVNQSYALKCDSCGQVFSKERTV